MSYNERAVSYINKYKDKIMNEIKDKDYCNMIIHDINDVLLHICNHKWSVDYFDINGEMIQIEICSVCNINKKIDY